MAKAAGLYNLSLPEMLAWLLPGLFGGGVAYWGPQPFQSNSEYFGLLPLSLALVGIASRPALLWPWGFAAAAGIILAFGPSLPPGAALNLLPFFGGFRAGVRWLALTHLAIAVLAAYGFASLRERAGRRALCLAAGWLVFAAACVILAPRSPGFARTVLERRYMKENVRWFPVDPRLVAPGIRSSLESGALTGLATAAALALPVVPFASPAALAGAIWIVTAWDLRRAAVPFFASARLRDPPDPPVEMILRDVHARNTGAGPAWKRELFRISTDEYAAIVNLRMFRRLQWVNGYHSVPLRRYLGLYDAITSPPSAILPALLNVRYSLNASRGAVARHPNVMPRAYFARETVACRDIGEAIAVIKSPGWTPARIPLENPPPELAGRTWDDRGTIDLAVGRDELSARVVTRAPALLVLSETWFPAWKAEADGKRIPVLKACGALRAVAVPAGDHSIRLVYDSWRLKVGLLISALAWSLLALVPAALSFRARRDP